MDQGNALGQRGRKTCVIAAGEAIVRYRAAGRAQRYRGAGRGWRRGYGEHEWVVVRVNEDDRGTWCERRRGSAETTPNEASSVLPLLLGSELRRNRTMECLILSIQGHFQVSIEARWPRW